MDKLKSKVLSDENIFLSINLMDSYLQNKELLTSAEREKVAILSDVFNDTEISKTIKLVHTRLLNILENDDNFFECSVYLKPKGHDNGKKEFRPLHTASLIDQIAMIAMLQVLVYDTDSQPGQLIPSELSRLIPSNFYGNRISYDGRKLFKHWTTQYQNYSSKSTELLNEYCKTGEYKYEVSLDLKNFFPSINPGVIYTYITKHMPMMLDDERVTYEKILKKLLIFKLNGLNAKTSKWYLNTESDNIVPPSYAKGLPQGLPHTYFMANIFMLIIRDIYKKIFPGEMLFYVDDSVLFTNGEIGKLDEVIFEKNIDKINKSISGAENDILKLNLCQTLLPSDYSYSNFDFGVQVHSYDKKSNFSRIEDAQKNSGEIYLRNLSRETSNLGFDISTMFADEEADMLLSRSEALLSMLNKELDRHEKDSAKSTSYENDIYRKKLIRYKKFFSYRKTILEYKCIGDIKTIKSKLINDIQQILNDDIATFYNNYNDDILASSIQFVFKRCSDEDEDTDDLITLVIELSNKIYDGELDTAYFHTAYKPYLENCSEHYFTTTYDTLCKEASLKYSKYKGLSVIAKRDILADLINQLARKDSEFLYQKLGLSPVFEYSKIVRNNTSSLDRMVLNAIFSTVYEYIVDDRYEFCKHSRNPMQYDEIRTLAHLRNPNFILSDFTKTYNRYSSAESQETIDYSLLQVMDIFKKFIGDYNRIDNLILVHKYCCDTWKNGSKYLHFYTLHNQEHAVSLIRSSITLLHAISYLKIKQIDYYILFISCYLHDVSMVTLPNDSLFTMDNTENSNNILTEFIDGFNPLDTISAKSNLCSTYHKIDSYFENAVRSRHSDNSANEIRYFEELSFLDAATRELVAKVSEAHCHNAEDIYYTKSKAQKELVNEKFIKILLRLSDILDISRYRISKVILAHNLKNMDKVSRFHWISHLLTDGYALDSKYDLVVPASDKNSILKKGSITEKLVLTISVLMLQTTEVDTNKKCKFVSGSLYEFSEGKDLVIHCDRKDICRNEKCTFMCKWFTLKNAYLLDEFSILKEFLNNISDNFFASDVEIRVKVISNASISNEIFDYLNDYLSNSN